MASSPVQLWIQYATEGQPKASPGSDKCPRATTGLPRQLAKAQMAQQASPPLSLSPSRQQDRPIPLRPVAPACSLGGWVSRRCRRARQTRKREARDVRAPASSSRHMRGTGRHPPQTARPCSANSAAHPAGSATATPTRVPSSRRRTESRRARASGAGPRA
jgi:hypothetical protein